MSDHPITLYGIPNCDQVRKARNWLNAQGVVYVFHDFKKAGAGLDLLTSWQGKLGWETLLNRQGTTWRQLPDGRKAQVCDALSAANLMNEFPSLIKRPILCAGEHCIAGFAETAYQNALNN